MESHDWREALDLFQRAQHNGQLSGLDLEKMAEAAFFAGQAALAIESKERAFKVYQAAGERARAAFIAIDLCREYAYKGQASISAAWLRRGERLLEGEPESFAHGYLALAHAEAARGQGQAVEALEAAERAVRIGTESGDADLLAQGLVSLGSVKIAGGDVAEGLELLEEATVSAVNGELSPIFTGVTLCQMISVCRDLADYARAGEWTEATERWCEKQSISGFPGICRIHRAEVVALAGAWERAEEELVRATRELAAYNATPPVADGFYAIAQIRFRRGDLEGAEAALREAHSLGRSPQPLLALIRLAEGNVRTASNAIKSTLAEETWDQWTRTRLLPAQVEIAVAAGEPAVAREAAEELDRLVGTYDALAMKAQRDLAWGRVLLAEDDPPGAIRHLRKAIEQWGRVPAPYEVAMARWLLAMALRRIHDEEAADLELEASHRDFTRLGAMRAAAAVARDIQAAADRRTGPVQIRMTFMFTDIVGSTNLAELLGDQAWDQLLRWHDEALRGTFSRKGGEVVNSTGDGFFVAFESGKAAIECAIDIQRLLADHRRTTGFAPMVRIGVHTAGANRHGSDYSGVGVHVAARVAALAGGGEIVTSTETLEEAGEVPVTNRHPASLKGVAEPVVVASVVWS